VRASATASTRSAPAARSAAAQASRVAPVVTTSSTSQTRVAGCRRAWKTPWTLRRRSARPRPVWLGVSRVRRSPSGSSGSPNARAMSRAATPGGLNPRLRNRWGCMGTGMTASGRADGTFAAAAHASVRATASGAGSRPPRPRRGYLNRVIQASTGPVYQTAAVPLSSADGVFAQAAQRPSPPRGGRCWHPVHARGSSQGSANRHGPHKDGAGSSREWSHA